MNYRTQLWSAIVAAALFLGACGSDGGQTIGLADTTTARPSTETTSVITPPTDPPVTTTTVPPSTTSSVPGEPLFFGTAAGTVLGIVGVEIDDTLNFRTQPAASAEIVASILTLDDSHTISSRGDSWLTATSVWWHLTVDGEEAWANQKYLAAIGLTDDITSELTLISADTIRELGMIIAESRASIDPASTIVVVDESPGDASSLAEITIDVIGLGDDALKGERLHIFANVTYEDDGDTVASVDLKSVERTLLCSRGVSEGLCL